MRLPVVFIAFLSAFGLSSISQAQYQWHIVHTNQIDTTRYGFQAISCSGENCSALCYSWSSHPQRSVYQFNVNVIFHFAAMVASHGILSLRRGFRSNISHGIPPEIFGAFYDIKARSTPCNAMAVGAFGITVRTIRQLEYMAN